MRHIVCCAVALALLGGPAWAAAERPNVVLLMADDMGWAQTGYYGHPVLKTPSLDAMAANGLRMDRFYAAAQSCSPTRASVVTGRSNDRTGVFQVGDPIDLREKTLGAAFQQAGYATAHFGKWHLNAMDTPEHPLAASDARNPGALGFDVWVSETNQFNLDPVLSRNGAREEFEGEGSEVIVDEALAFIAARTAEKRPFFAMIWFSSPHRIFEALAADIEPFAAALDASSARHHAEIVAMDRAIGTLRAGLRRLGVADDTLLWFKSDNGGLPDIDYPPDYPGVHPNTTGHLRGFKKDFYEGGLRVPAVVEWPGGIAPRVTNFPASTMDIFPTLIDVAGLDPGSIHPVHDGISLVEVFEREPGRREQPIGFRVGDGRAWLDNDWKLVRNYNVHVDAPFELYNVIGDPGEQHDLAAQRPELVASMRTQLDAWGASVERSVAGADYAPAAEADEAP